MIALLCYLLCPCEEWRLKSVMFFENGRDVEVEGQSVCLSCIEWRKAGKL